MDQLDAIKEMLTMHLSMQGIQLHKPFRCKNPLHEDVHPSMRFDPKRNKVHCFSCGADYDIFDLIGIEYDLTGSDVFRKAEELYGDALLVKAAVQSSSGSQPVVESAANSRSSTNADFFRAAHERVYETDYWARRGLSKKVVDDFMIGYSPAWKHPDAPNSPVSPRLIIPMDDRAYYARDTRAVLTETEAKNSKKKVGFAFFNIDALIDAKKPVFIVEGEFDALSIIEVGGEAVSLGGVGNIKRFVSEISEALPSVPLLILLDNDERGQAAASNLVEHLNLHHILHQRLNLPSQYKDVNEMLCADREGLKAVIHRWEREFARPETDVTKKLTRMSQIDAVGKGASYVSTGFKSLDRALGGGIYGLTVLGGISSVGKTTFATQIADQIATQQTPVILASLEMPVADLCRKSIAREAAKLYANYPDKLINSEDLRHNTQHLSDNIDVFNQAKARYDEYANRIYAMNTSPSSVMIDLEDAISIVRDYEERDPIIILDHLQMIDSGRDKISDKQAMDSVVAVLHNFVRKFHCPVLAISTLSREAYNKPVQRESFKESGAIEYGADILLGMQFTNVGKKDFDVLKESQAAERFVTISVIKNRLGPVGQDVRFSYYTNIDFFEERVH